MKKTAMIFALILGMFVAAPATACPTGQFSMDTKFQWLLGGQFRGVTVGATGVSDVRGFAQASSIVGNHLMRNEINLDRWFVGGRTRTDVLFAYKGTGTRDFVTATRKAVSLFVPSRRAES